VVHGHLPRAELLCMLSRPKGGFCVSRHNAEKFWPDAPNLISRALSRLVVHESEACISISKAVLEFGLKSGELPNSDKVKLIHYGIKSNGTIIARKHGRQNLNLLCIARLEKQKDLQTLLYSIQVAKSKSPNVHLHILGEGSLRQDLQLLCEHLEIMPFVTFHGTVKNVDYFYDLADLFILPSLYEGFGLVYLEALANGLPVVTSRNSAALEIFGVDYIGLFDIGDYRELARLIVKMSNKNIQKKLLPEYRMILQRFNSQTMAKEINKVYELTF
jgi:glycosyltransferase involved in cell wall biosynthesis